MHLNINLFFGQLILTFFLMVCFFSCSTPNELLKRQIKKNNYLASIAFDPGYEVQILYTYIHPKTGKPITSVFQADTIRYFYPASTVKMPVAFLALEKIRLLQKQGFHLDTETKMEHGVSTPPQTSKSHDDTTNDGKPSVKRYIEKIFLVSDNDAYNRLYEFLGQDSINEILRRKKIFTSSVINHRLGVQHFDFEDNRRMNPVTFTQENKVVYSLSERYNVIPYVHRAKNARKGNGFLDLEGNRIDQPFDFSLKNYYNLFDMQNTLARIIHPEWFKREERFDLEPQDYSFLKETMKKRPRDDIYYRRDTTLQDNHVKFFLFGDKKEPIPDHIHMYNKVGTAYGYLIDCAFIEDIENKVNFYLTAVIHVNNDGVYNDGIYEYENVGLPFLAELGRVMYDYTKKKSR